MIYFDNAATTKPSEAALKAFLECAGTVGNPSSLHSLGIAAEERISGAKREILSHFPEKGDFIFTSGATESNNLALRSVAQSYRRNGNRIVTTAIEHPSVSVMMDRLSEEGFLVERLAPSDSFAEELINSVDENTFLLSFMAVNNETGFVIDSEQVYRAVKAKYPKCIVHVDGVQGYLKRRLYGDLISVSAHKVHGFKGSGGLFVKKGIRLVPLICGGGQQNGLRSGTEAAELSTAFGAAVAHYRYDEAYFQKMQSHLLQLIGDIDGVSINSRNHLPNILNFSISGVKSEVMLHFLEEKEIFVSSGSACSKGKTSEILQAFGTSRSNADSALRVSFCMENTLDEIDVFVSELKAVVAHIRRNDRKGR